MCCQKIPAERFGVREDGLEGFNAGVIPVYDCEDMALFGVYEDVLDVKVVVTEDKWTALPFWFEGVGDEGFEVCAKGETIVCEIIVWSGLFQRRNAEKII